jgi:hypothetical protein
MFIYSLLIAKNVYKITAITNTCIGLCIFKRILNIFNFFYFHINNYVQYGFFWVSFADKQNDQTRIGKIFFYISNPVLHWQHFFLHI